MPYTWDEAKRSANLAKHGVDFADAERFVWETALVSASLRREARGRALGAQETPDPLPLWERVASCERKRANEPGEGSNLV